MNDDIISFITDHFGEGQKELLTESFELFELYDLDGYRDDFVNIIMTADNTAVDSMVMKFMSIVSDYVMFIIHSHDIRLKEDTPLSVMNEIARGLLVLENFEDSDTMVRMAFNTNESAENLCDLLTLVTDKDATYFMQHIEYVDDSLLKLIVELNKEKANTVDQESITVELLDKNIARLKALALLPEYKQTIGFRLIMDDVPLGLPFDTYAQYGNDTFETTSNDEIAREIIVMLAMSSDGITMPQITFRKWSDSHFSDLNQITQIDIAVNKRLNDLERNALTGLKNE